MNITVHAIVNLPVPYVNVLGLHVTELVGAFYIPLDMLVWTRLPMPIVSSI